MLTHLQIRDFAIIDLIDLEVRAGLTVLTGETGAGKSIVVSGRSVIVIKLIDRPDTRAQVTCDGVSLGELMPGDRLEVHPTLQKITLLHPNKFEYYRLLRSKLHWGRGGFNKSE